MVTEGATQVKTYGHELGAHSLGIGAFNPEGWWIHLHQVIPIAQLFQYYAYLGITSLSSSTWVFGFKLTVFLFKYLRMLIAVHIT